MTVSTSTNSVVYRGNSAATQFAVPFKVVDEDHLRVRRRVYATGEVVYAYVGTDYSYTGIGDSSGTLTLAGTALDDDYELVIERIVPYTQDLDIVNAGGFYPETVEEQLDIMVMAIQQLADLVGRGAVVPVGESGLEMTKVSDRANKFFGFDAGGDFVALSGTGSDSALRDDLATLGTSLIVYDPPDAGTSVVVLEDIINRLPLQVETFRVDEFGATRSDKDTIIAAIAAWKAKGGGILEGEVDYLYDIEDIAPNDVTFILDEIENGTLRNLQVVCSSTAPPVGGEFFPVIFGVRRCANLMFENIYGSDTEYDALTAKGAKLFDIQGTAAALGATENVSFRDIRGEDLIGGIGCTGTDFRIRQVNVEESCRFTRTYYPANFQENGDDCSVFFTAIDCVRAYLPYGVSNHRFGIRVWHNGVEPAGQQPVLIKRYINDTKGIKGWVSFGGVLAYGSNAAVNGLVVIEAQATSGNATFDDIAVDLTIEPDTTNPNSVPGFVLQSYDGSDLEDSTVFNCATTNASNIVTPAVAMGRFKVGQEIVGPGIPFGTTVTVVGASTLTLSANASATAAAAKLQLRTATDYGHIRLGGDLSPLTSTTKILCRSVPKTAAVIALDPGLAGVDLINIDAENIRFKPAIDREFFIMRGDPSLRAVRWPLTGINAGGTTFAEATLTATSNPLSSGASGGKRRYDLTLNVVGGAGGVTITATERSTPASPSQNTAPTFTWAGNPNIADSLFSMSTAAGGVYDNANAFLKAEVHWCGSILG